VPGGVPMRGSLRGHAAFILLTVSVVLGLAILLSFRAQSEAKTNTVTIPTESPGPTEGAASHVLFSDDPANGKGGLARSSPHPDQYTVGYMGDEYSIVRLDTTANVDPVVAVPGDYTDSVLSVSVDVVGDTSGRYVQIYCRRQSDGSGYELRVAPTRGTYSLDRRDGNRSTTLAPLQAPDVPNPAVRIANQENAIALTCAGPTISVSVNSVQIATVTDGMYRSGQHAIGVNRIYTVNGTAEARFSKIKVLAATSSVSASPTNDARPRGSATPTTTTNSSAADGVRKCLVYSPYDIRPAGSEDGMVAISSSTGDPTERCRTVAQRGGSAWRLVSRSGAGGNLFSEYVGGTVQCETQPATGVRLEIRTVGPGRADGGFWCRSLGLAGPNTTPTRNASAETLADWGPQVFRQGIADCLDRSMNPDLSVNPNANSPYVKWFLDRFSQQVPANVYLHSLLEGIPETVTAATRYRDAACDALRGRSSTTVSNARSNLHQLIQLQLTITAGGHLSNKDQERSVSSMMYDPYTTAAVIAAQYRDTIDGPGWNYVAQKLNGLATSYVQNPAESGVPFLQYASDRLGLQ
jgi:hypothetical protein